MAKSDCHRLFRGTILMSISPCGCLGCLSYRTNEGERRTRREFHDDIQSAVEMTLACEKTANEKNTGLVKNHNKRLIDAKLSVQFNYALA